MKSPNTPSSPSKSGDSSEVPDTKPLAKVAPPSHFSKPKVIIKEPSQDETLKEKEKQQRIQSLDEISEKENSLNAISETSKSHEISDAGGSLELKDRKRPNLHIFTHHVDAIQVFNKLNKLPEQRSCVFFIFELG